MPIVVEIPNRGSIEFDDGASDADIDAIVSKEFPPTPDDSYNKVLQFQGAQIDYTPSKQEFLDYLKVSKTKPLLGEKPLETIGTAAVQTVEDIASMPYKVGEAIGQYMDPPEGVTPMQLAGGTAAEIAVQSRLKAENMGRGLIDTALNKLSDITGKLRNDDDKYEAFLAAAEIKRQLARANAPEDQRVPASRDVLQAYGIPEEAISQQGLDVGGFLADPSSIAFAGGGKLASALAQRAIPLIPRAGQILQRAGERISNLGRVPENMAGRFTAGVTGSEQMGQAVQEGIAKGTTGITLGEAAGLPITMNVPGLGTVAKTITATKGLGGAMETVGEAGTVSGGPSLTPTQRGLLGAGERIAAAEGASSRARALGTAIARSGLETPIRGAATILLPMVGAGAAGGALAALTGEEGDAVAAAIGSGAGFGVFDGGFTLAKAVQANAFNGARVRQTAVDDLNTRPTDVQFTYIDPVAGEQIATIKDSEARATLYGRLNNKQLTKALSEVAAAEGAGVDVIFHTDGDTVPAGLQTVNYAGAAIGPKDIKSGRPTILINVDKAIPETIPHEILHARITQEVVNQLGSQVINAAVETPQGPSEFKKQFVDFAEKYAKQIEKSGGKILSDEILTQLRDAFDPAQQRAQKIESLKRITDEFAAYYTQEMLKGKDPKTMLPGRIPSFFEMALNNAKEAVSERFTRRALQAGFDPVARTFYDANGRRIKLDWMEDAIKNLVNPKEGYEPTEQKVDINKMTQAQQNAVIMARGYSDLFMTAPDGSIVRPLSKAELIARTADIANRTMQVVESVPQAERTSISGMDAYGNPVIEGRLSLAEADAVSKSGIFGPSSSRTLIDIATAIRNGTLMEGNYWKVYGSTGRSGVFGESQKLFLPYGISINSKGGVNVKVVDWGKVQARMYKALSKPGYKNLFNNYDQAMSTMRDVYLKNIAETGAVPSAEALGGGIEGAKKRNMFNEIMGAVPKKGDVMVNFPTAGYVANRRGGSVYQDLRLERIQNADTTSAQIPWTGDMGEQSSYRRTQLNFMPAENIGETKVSTDDNGGYRILSKNGKFRLYGPDGSTVGIFDTQEQAKLKAEKDYATQERLQPEVRQQQRPLGDEVRQATEAGGRNRAVGGQEGQGQGGAVRQEGDVRFMPSSLTARDINAIADEVGGGEVKGGAKAFGAFMRSMRNKGITLRDVVKSYGITLSSIQRQELAVSTIKKNWPDAPFAEGTKVRPEDAFAQLLGTPEGQKYLDAAESGVFDEQAADVVVQKFRSFGFHNKLKEQMKTAIEQFYPKAQEIIDAVNSMPTDQFIDYVRNNVKGISYGKVGFWSGQLGRGDIPTFDSRQGKLVYGKEVPVTKQVLIDQKDRLTQLGIKVPNKFKDFAQTLLHHEVWDRLNQSDTEHGPIKEAMLRYMPSDTDYLSAVKQGDTKAAQQMVDEAAKAEGYGTNVGGFFVKNANESIGKLPTWADEIYKFGKLASENGRFETVKQYNRAASYGDAIEPKRNSVTESALRYWDGSDGTLANYIFEQGLKGEEIGPFVFAERIGNAPERGYSLNYRDQTGEQGVSVLGLLDPSKGLVKQNDGTFELFNDGERRFVGGFLTPFKGSDGEPLLIGIQFDGKRHQIKSADPITKDDNGNVIPLSQRFKATSEDIRYMPAADREVTRAVNINDFSQDFTGQILKGQKTIETRDTLKNAMQGVLGQRIGLTRTGTGDTKVVGYATVAKDPIVYRNESEFRRDQGKHLVEPNSKYDIKKGGVKYGYELTDVTPVEPFAPKSVSRMYSVIEPRYMPAGDMATGRNMPADIKRDIGRNVDFAKPPTDSEAVDALSSEKKAKFGAARSIKPGTQVAARIDIPAFLRTGKYVVAVHEPDGAAGGPGKVIGYDTVTRLQNPKFVVKPGVQRIYEGKSAKFPVATVDGKIMADRSIPSDLENYVPVGMDPKEHAYFYDKRTDQPVISGSEAVSVGNTVFVKNPVYGKPEDFRFMPSPDSAMPGAYSFPGGYRAIPGKAKGSLRIYGPAGSLIGIASSLDEAQRILRRTNK